MAFLGHVKFTISDTHVAFRNPSVELPAVKSYVVCFVHTLVIYSFSV